eukprot:jgi/Chlat1/3294/Chrsp22S03446
MARLRVARWVLVAVVACVAVSVVCATADEKDNLWDVEYSVDEYAPDVAASEVVSTEPEVYSTGGGADITGDPEPIFADDALYHYVVKPMLDWSAQDPAQVEPYDENPYAEEIRSVYADADEYVYDYYEQVDNIVPDFPGSTEPYDSSEAVSSNDMGLYSSYSVFSRSSTLQLLSGLERVLELHLDILRAAAPGFVAPLRPDSPALIQARTNALQRMACGRGSCMPQVQTLSIVVDGDSMSATATATEYITVYDNEYMNYEMETSSGSMEDRTAMEFPDLYDDIQPEPSMLTLPPPDFTFSKYVSSREFFIQWACLAGLVAFTVCFWVRNFVQQRRDAETILVVSEATSLFQQSSNMTNPLLTSQPEYITITTETLPLLPSGKQAPRDYSPPEMV